MQEEQSVVSKRSSIKQATLSLRARPVASSFCGRYAPFAAALALLGLGACQTTSLHASHGLRYREAMTAQVNARGTRDVNARGEEVARSLAAYYDSFSSGGAGGAPEAPSNMTMTAGVRPLH